ncbi:MAG: hypothetical protein IT376_10580 [Polyangiaceae bacterium]|nr:hypothetical protein [Polyangiaceae bacterium]
MSLARWLAVVGSGALALTGCGDDRGAPPATAPRGCAIRHVVDGSGAPPRYGEAPFPTDAALGADGNVVSLAGLELLTPTQAPLLAAHLARLDGFGTRPVVELPIECGLDPASLPARTSTGADPAFVVEVGEGAPTRGEVVPFEWRWDASRGAVFGSPEPGTVLRSGGEYAVVATSLLRDVEGRALSRGAGLDEILAGTAPERWRTTADALRFVTTEVVARGAYVAGFAAFRVQSATRTLLAARAALEVPAMVPAPALAFTNPATVFDTPARLDALLGVAERDETGRERWGWSNPTGIAHEHVGVLATGSITLPRFTRDDTGDDSPDDETFDRDPATGAPRVIEPRRAIPVTLVLPAAPPPPKGFPIAVFGHGLGASRHAVVTFAEPLTRAGFAVAAIDFAGHGSRAKDVDLRNDTAKVVASFTGDPALPDGFGDVSGLGTTLALFEGFLNLSAVRDSLLQSVLDLSGLVRALRDPALDLAPLAAPWGGVAPRLDPERVAYLGESFGTIVGGVFAAVEPNIGLHVLDVPGAGVLDLEIATSPGLGTLVIPLARSVYGFEGRFDRFHPLVALAQAILDPADPLTWARHVLRERATLGELVGAAPHVLAIEVVGDEVMGNEGTHALARALGLEQLEPSLVAVVPGVASPASAHLDGRTAVVVQYAPATHGANWTSETGQLQFLPGFPAAGEDPFPRLAAPVTIRNPIYETLDQVIEALQTHHATGLPVVRSTLAPRRDFDGDGLEDDAELAVGRDPHAPD